MKYITEDESKPLLMEELQFGEHSKACYRTPCPCIVVSVCDFVNSIFSIQTANEKEALKITNDNQLLIGYHFAF